MASGGLNTLSELRIVLLGNRISGKSSSGNTILGREEFDLRTSAQSVRRHGEVSGRQVTVVNTPGWWANHPVEWTPEMVKQDIVLSVSLCPPGPHTVLLVIRVDGSLTEKHRRSVEGHMELLGETVWSHTIILFTFGDCLGDTTIEQHIESDGKELQRLVEKCGNRYHVFNNKNMGDGSQVTELLEKIEEMVTGRRGGYYKVEKEFLTKTENRRKAEEERAKQRLMKVKEQREALKSQLDDSLHLSELRIVLLGSRTSGKSSSGNTILGKEEFDLKTSAQCVRRHGEVAGREVTVVDTPGWWANVPIEETPELVLDEIVLSMSLCPPGPHTVLLVIDVDVSFKEEHRKSVEEHLKLLGETVWSHTIILFTFGDCLGDTTIEQHIESEGKALQGLVEKCGNRYHVFNNKSRGDGSQVTELLEKIEEMVTADRSEHDGSDDQHMKCSEYDFLTSQSAFEDGSERKSKGPIWVQNSDTMGLQCSAPGLFQCRLTGLVFQMEGEGEVQYKTIQWDESLLHSTGQVPAGPLYSIKCPQGSVSELYLPHCEVLSGEGFGSLSVAHVTGDSVEVLPPLRVTETHIVVTIRDLSLWGLVRTYIPFLSIKGQVLPFLKSVDSSRSVLDVIVLPSNVPLSEVKQQQTGSTYIQVCSGCTLIRWETYFLSSDLENIQEKITPECAAFDCNYGPNFHPSFQVFLDPNMKDLKLSLLNGGAGGDLVWTGMIPLPGAPVAGCEQTRTPPKDSADKLLRSVRKVFVDRVSKPVVDNLLDVLLQEKVINTNEMETVKEMSVRAEKAREIIDMVLNKGPAACSKMKASLVELDPYLSRTFGFS